MKDTHYAAVICFILGLLAIFASQVEAAEPEPAWRLFELKEVSVEYKDFFPGGYRPTLNGNGLDNRTLGKEVVLRLDVDLGRYFFFNHRVHGGSDEIIEGDSGRGQFRDVGWNFLIGARIASFLTVQYEHHSQHMLDHASPTRFPVEDSLGFTLFFYRDRTPGASAF
jgi:hypothetical protein